MCQLDCYGLGHEFMSSWLTQPPGNVSSFLPVHMVSQICHWCFSTQAVLNICLMPGSVLGAGNAVSPSINSEFSSKDKQGNTV